MTVHRRYGLRTLALPMDATRTTQLLSGRWTAVVRLLGEGGEPVEQPGDRILLTDGRGRSVAVVEVREVVLAPLGSVADDVRRGGNPDSPSPGVWAAAWCREWAPVGDRPGGVPVVCLRVRVVGLEEGVSASPGDALTPVPTEDGPAGKRAPS